MTAIRSWEADFARRLGVGGLIDFDKTTIGKTLHIPCAVGKHVVDFKIRPNLDPNGAVKEMLHKGWTIGRRRIVCPDCKRKSEEEKAERRRAPKLTPEQLRERQSAAGKARQAEVTIEQRREWGRKGAVARIATLAARKAAETQQPIPEREIIIVPPQQETMTATDKARAAKRDAMESLTLSFKLAPDGKTGTYSDGYSDAKIAKETGLSEKAVGDLREEFFGPLGMPDELGIIQAELAHAKRNGAEKMAAHEAEIARIERRFSALCGKMGWPTT